MELVAEALRLSYRGVVAVEGVSLRLTEGQVVAIVGPNGCGKSTLLRGLARLHPPAAGRVLLDGTDLWQLSPRAVARRIALLPQTPLVPEALTVAELVRFGRHPHQGVFRQWSPADERAVNAALEATGLHALAHRRVDQLSGGQRQRCWLALVLAQDAPLLLLDEPTSMLDLGQQVEVFRLLRALAAAGRGIAMVLHDLSAAARHADVLIALRHGRVVAVGPPAAVVEPVLVRHLYDIDAHIVPAPDDAPVIAVPAGVAPPRRG